MASYLARGSCGEGAELAVSSVLSGGGGAPHADEVRHPHQPPRVDCHLRPQARLRASSGNPVLAQALTRHATSMRPLISPAGQPPTAPEATADGVAARTKVVASRLLGCTLYELHSACKPRDLPHVRMLKDPYCEF